MLIPIKFRVCPNIRHKNLKTDFLITIIVIIKPPLAARKGICLTSRISKARTAYTCIYIR